MTQHRRVPVSKKPLGEVQDAMWRRAESEKGTSCPCCQQFVKVYKRPITSTMAAGLIRIHRFFAQGSAAPWLHVPKYLASQKHASRFAGGDEAKLTYWGLLEAKRATRQDGSPRNGFYKITQLGSQFVLGKVRVPKYAFMYNSNLLGLSNGTAYPAEFVMIQDALKNRFNYTELMTA